MLCKDVLFGSQVSLRTPRGTLAPLRVTGRFVNLSDCLDFSLYISYCICILYLVSCILNLYFSRVILDDMASQPAIGFICISQGNGTISKLSPAGGEGQSWVNVSTGQSGCGAL